MKSNLIELKLCWVVGDVFF